MLYYGNIHSLKIVCLCLNVRHTYDTHCKIKRKNEPIREKWWQTAVVLRSNRLARICENIKRKNNPW